MAIELRPIEESVAYQEIFREGWYRGWRKGWREGWYRGWREGELDGQLKLLEELRDQIDPAVYQQKNREIRAALDALEQ